jgi:hypothetical protein
MTKFAMSSRSKRPPPSPGTQAEPSGTRRKLDVSANPLHRDDSNDALMDEMVLKIYGWVEPSTINQAAFLLATIVSTSKKLVGSKYEKTPNAMRLLQDNPELLEQIRSAWSTKSFKDIRDSREDHPFRIFSTLNNLVQLLCRSHHNGRNRRA